MLKSELQTLRQQGATKLATEAELSARYHMSRQGSGSYLSQTNTPDTLRQIAVITTFLDDYIFPPFSTMPRSASPKRDIPRWCSPRKIKSPGSGKS